MNGETVNLVIAGVGGQGNVLASRVIAMAAIEAGYRVSVGETFGASQRGGSVMSHVRITAGTDVGPLIPWGRADVVVAMEPMEGLRVLNAFGNPNTRVILNNHPNYPIGVLQGQSVYPSQEELVKEISRKSRLVLSFSATALAVKAGNPAATNITMVGALAETNLLPIAPEIYRQVIGGIFKGAARNANLTTFDLGMARAREQS